MQSSKSKRYIIVLLFYAFHIFSAKFINPIYTPNNLIKKEDAKLPFFYEPKAIFMSPDGKTLSFIDNGRLRIKNPLQRRAQTIELPHHIRETTAYNWIDCTTLLMVAYVYINEIDSPQLCFICISLDKSKPICTLLKTDKKINSIPNSIAINNNKVFLYYPSYYSSYSLSSDKSYLRYNDSGQ